MTMITNSTLIKQIDVIDPDSGGEVNICVFKHENGGLFGLDSSYIEQVLDDDGEAFIPDPFSMNGNSTEFNFVILHGV